MKWLKDLFKTEPLKGVAPTKPLEVKPAPNSNKDIKVVPTASADKPNNDNVLSNDELVARYKRLKEIPKVTMEFPVSEQKIDRKPIPAELLAILNPIQRKLISVQFDYGFVTWKAKNPTKTNIANGEIIAISAEMMGLKNDYDLAVETGDYQAFPFSDFLTGELRAKVLNTITSEDTEEKLLREFYELLPQFASNDDINIIRTLIETARIKLPKRSYTFFGSINGKDTGYEETRNDSLDLLALKELVLAMDDKTLAPLNLATGFFSKLVEFSESVKDLMKFRQDFAGIILKVENDYLKEIRVAQAPRVGKVGLERTPENKDVTNGLSRYSPLSASVAMYLTYLLKVEVEIPDNGKIYMNGDTVKITDVFYKKGDVKFYSPQTRYYAIVDGCVAGPNDFRFYGHQYLTANNTRIYGGEVFMFHMVEGKPQGTKIAFSPRDYNQLHPFLRIGGLVYGDQDMSYQSVPWCAGDIAEDVVNDYKDWWKAKVDGGNPHGDAFSPAVVMARNLYFCKDSKGEPTNQADVFRPENYPALGLAIASISGETGFTRQWWIDNICFIHMFYSLDVRNEIENSFYNHITTLNRHWNLKIYLQNGLGVTLEKQATLTHNLAEKMQKAKEARQLAFVLEFYAGETDASKAFRERFHKKKTG